MIKAKGTSDDGREFLLLGLSEGNLKRLRKDEPILIKKEDVQIPFDIYILWGATEADLVKMVKPGIHDETKLHVGKPHG